jgi:hypothetical protein
MLLNGQSLLRRPFKQRYDMIQKHIVEPRMAEREMCKAGKVKYR